MEVSDGRGKNMKDLMKKNILVVEMWFDDNPGCTAKQCSESTGLSYKTVLKHIKTLKEK